MAVWRKDLTPCPFCGHAPCYSLDPDTGRHEIWCENLECDVGVEVSEPDLIIAELIWNTRAPMAL